ncbi:hypothetical protein OV203_38515 [Nannocystis sp. ILAH1]|uniref:hypothetical protein n=1 Tax=Nannocystis sp. ILAH1 TaxID=2996789 RepID=UPI002271FEEE|nr:hypothetical protein [Nannocystis sp. ILAH1]MCY0993098.1 hypothetical protein [Nannocystis sp. ILAH1]
MQQQQQNPDNAPSPVGCLLRIFWMFVSNAIVYGSLAGIVMHGAAFPSILDFVIWSTVVFTILARRVDITRWGGKTAQGEPATLIHWRRHAVIVVIVTIVASVIAHAIGV